MQAAQNSIKYTFSKSIKNIEICISIFSKIRLVDHSKRCTQIYLQIIASCIKLQLPIVILKKMIISEMHHCITYVYINFQQIRVATEDNGAANVTSKVKDNGSNKVSENHKEDVAQRSGADTKHETNQLDDQQAEDKQPVADAQQQNVVLDNNTLHATRV